MRSSLNTNLMFLLASLMGLTACSLDSEYFDPRTTSRYELRTTVIPAAKRELVQITSNGQTIFGVFIEAENGAPETKPTIVYFHGDDKDIDKYWPRLEKLYPLDLNIFIFDFQGYGRSTGSASLAAIKTNSEDVIDYLESRTDVDMDKLVYYSFSLGGIFGLHTAVNKLMPAAMITESIPASSKNSVRQNLKLGLPAQFFFDETFDNLGPIAQIESPLLMLHGDKDETVSYREHAVPLFQNAPEPKTTVTVEGAKHSTVIDTLGTTEYQTLIEDFLADSGL